MEITNAMISEINGMIQRGGGELRVNRIKAQWACFYYSKVSDIAELLKDAGFEVYKKGAAYMVKGHVEPRQVTEVIEKTEPEPEPESEPASAPELESEPEPAAKQTSDPVAEILAPLGNLDEKFDTTSQIEISGLLETMLRKKQWRIQDLAKESGVELSAAKDWLNELRQYGIITASLNTHDKVPRYIFTRNVENGTCYCSPELHTTLPDVGGIPLWGNRWAQIKNRVHKFEKASRFATTQDVRFSLGWPKEDFDATLEEFKRRSLLQVSNNIIRILRKNFNPNLTNQETKNKSDPKTLKFKLAMRECRVHPNDASEFVNVVTVLKKLGCRNRAWDTWLSLMVDTHVLELKYDPVINANHESRYRNYKVRTRQEAIA